MKLPFLEGNYDASILYIFMHLGKFYFSYLKKISIKFEKNNYFQNPIYKGLLMHFEL